jgi:hypothetical protein
MSSSVIAQVVGFVAFVAAAMTLALLFAPGGGAPRDLVPARAVIVPSASAATPSGADPTRGVPLRYAQLTPTPLPPLFVVRDNQPLALAVPGRAEVLAVTVDDHFESVTRYFGDTIPPEIAWDQKITLEPTLGVNSLPTTFLIDKQGRARLRWNGAQDWSSAAMDQLIAGELQRTIPAP